MLLIPNSSETDPGGLRSYHQVGALRKFGNHDSSPSYFLYLRHVGFFTATPLLETSDGRNTNLFTPASVKILMFCVSDHL